jgi:hypothetical protein
VTDASLAGGSWKARIDKDFEERFIEWNTVT